MGNQKFCILNSEERRVLMGARRTSVAWKIIILRVGMDMRKGKKLMKIRARGGGGGGWGLGGGGGGGGVGGGGGLLGGGCFLGVWGGLGL